MKIAEKIKLMGGVSICVLVPFGGQAYAQEQAAANSSVELEEVIVTGTLGSLKRAMDVKRAASGMVEAISAEDLGKFPDQNIAESLQRIPGLTIDRNGGEGQFVTARGFGPSFNTVLVNGRRLASEVGNREFSFDLFPSELIAGAEVFKSGTARLQEGGIGATIDMSTARPLDNVGLHAVGTARGLYDDNRDSASPQVFGLVSNTFADDSIGVLLSASYQQRKSAVDTFNNRGWNTGLISDLDPDVNVVNPGNVDRFFVAQNVQLGTTLQKRERTNVQAVVQYQPTNDLVVTLDGMWNDFDLTSESRFLNTWFSLTDLDNFVLDENGTALSVDQNANGAIEARAQNDGRPTQTQFGGFNVEWAPSEAFEHNFDFFFSHAENKPKGTDTGQSVLGFRSPFSFINDGSTAIPFTRFTVDNATALDRSNFLFHIAQFGGDGDSKEAANVVGTDLYEIKYDGKYRPGSAVTEIRYGVSYGNEQKNVRILRSNQEALCTFCGFFVDVPSNLEQELLFDFSVNGLLPNGGGFVDSTGKQITNFLADTVAGDTAAQASPAVLALRDATLGLAPGTSQAQFEALGGFSLQERPESFSVDEDVFAAYVDVDLEGEVSDMPWVINAGFRWVLTKTTSTGARTPLLDIRLNQFDTTEFLQELGATADAIVTQSNEYNKLLPNFLFKLNMTDELVARLGVSQTMTRPQLTDLSPRLAILNTRPNFLVAVGGNPDLKPFTSTNLDGSLEYYFGDFNYFAVSGFWKEIDGFIVQTTAPEVLTIANADNIVDPRINGMSATFDVTRPTNAETARVRGVELSGQFTFDFLPSPLDGFGVTANALFVESNASVGQNTQARTSFGLPGLSDSQNAQFFYSKGPLDARISYSRRAKFLETLSNVIGGEPKFVEAFEQVDFKVSYTILDSERSGNYSVFVEGTNIFNEKIRKSGRFANQFLELTDTGARYAAGVRVAF